MAYTVSKFKLYQYLSIASLLFALIGFSYNLWRLEVSEHNTQVRTASFELLIQLSEFEQVVFSAFYDNDPKQGNPRKGWVKVTLVKDLSLLINESVNARAQALFTRWQEDWQAIESGSGDLELINDKIEQLRNEVRKTLKALN